MAVLEKHLRELEADGPQPFLWTKAQCHEMREMGWFIDTPMELLEGEQD